LSGVTPFKLQSRLFLSTAIVDYHMRAIYRKFGVTRRASLLRALLDAGLEV
jgi:DNA-binding CsgD family transcriptional regulator